MSKDLNEHEKYNDLIKSLQGSIVGDLINDDIKIINYKNNTIRFINAKGENLKYLPLPQYDKYIIELTRKLIVTIAKIYEQDIDNENLPTISINRDNFRFTAGLFHNPNDNYFNIDIANYDKNVQSACNHSVNIGDIVLASERNNPRTLGLFEVVMVGSESVMVSNDELEILVDTNTIQIVCNVTDRQDKNIPYYKVIQ